ncbi:hypothetical protein GTW15_05880 [Vibrio cholerae]|nr:hypothetical protein [Vibrio cholerae]
MKYPKSDIINTIPANPDLDPYGIILSKTARHSWNISNDVEVFIDKHEVVKWFKSLRHLGDDTIQMILVDGLLESNFHNISFIIRLSHKIDFVNIPSREIYDFLYTVVLSAPSGITQWIDESDYCMSRDVLALLSQNR